MAQSRPWRSIDPDLFRFTTTEIGSLYVAIMAAFEQSAVLAPALNVDQVRAALSRAGWDEPTEDDALQRALAALTGWRLLEATQDHGARFATPEEFERKSLLWALTPKGEAAVAGVLRAVDSLRHAVGLQTAVLDAMGDVLGELGELAALPRAPDVDAKIHLLVSQLEQSLESLVVSVRQFNGHLQRLLREDGTDDDVFADVKRRTVTYLEEYVHGVERPQRRLAVGIARLEAEGLSAVFDRALGGANLAPVAGEDPGPAWLAERDRRWQALRAWFAPQDASVPLVTGLLETARTAIIELLRVLSAGGTAAGGRRSSGTTSGAWRGGSPRPPASTRHTSSSRPPSGSGRRATPTSPASTATSGCCRPPGRRPSRWRLHRRCGPPAASPTAATRDRWATRGSCGPLASEPRPSSSRPMTHCGRRSRRTARCRSRGSDAWTRVPSGSCSSCSRPASKHPSTRTGPGAPFRSTGVSRSSCEIRETGGWRRSRRTTACCAARTSSSRSR
ncbi:MAG: TIGR02677 family protein [Actinomycetota bacterium]|nr:TIGR02677 family protein [Actinomycetota bacterium]